MESLDAVSSEIMDAIATADSLDVLENIRIDALGKKGRISSVSYTHLTLPTIPLV